jgi:hypothetical protein
MRRLKMTRWNEFRIMCRGIIVGMLLVLAVASFSLLGGQGPVEVKVRQCPVPLERLVEGGSVPVEVDFSAVDLVSGSARLEDGASVAAQVVFLGS